MPYTILEAPSSLGLRARGAEMLPDALREAGFYRGLNAGVAGRILPSFAAERDKHTGILNQDAIATYTRQLADALTPLLGDDDVIPIVLGGDCSILLGPLLALRRRTALTGEQYGLFFVDGHTDFYLPDVEPSGEMASMELAFATGHGANILSDIENLKPLIQEQNTVVFAYRDEEEARQDGSKDVANTAIHAYSLAQAQQRGIAKTANEALQHLTKRTPPNTLQGFWLHFDADVLDDEIMPAVDYRLPGGLSLDKASEVLRLARHTGQMLGVTVTIFNPTLDPTGNVSHALTTCLLAGLQEK